MKKLVSVFALLLGTCFAQLTQTASQLTVIPLPSPIPSMGNTIGANSTYLDPAYGTTILRCTDGNTQPGGDGLEDSWEVTDSGGSADRSWNSTGKRLRIVAANTGTTRVINFDPVNFTCSTIIPGSQTGVGAEWDARDPDVDYITQGTLILKRTFNGNNPPTTAPFFNFNTCPGLATLKPTWHTPLRITVDNSIFAMAFSDLGGQDTGEWIALYQPVTNGCQTWNTLTGVVTGQGFGQSGTINVAQRFSIHELDMGLGGVMSIAHGKTCTNCPLHGGPFLFKAGGLLAYQPTINPSGHSNIGWTEWANCNGPLCWVRPWNNPNALIKISSGVLWPAGTEQHMSWRPDVLETYPLALGSSTVNAPQPLVISAPLQQELFLVNMDGSFTRLAHTFSDGVLNSFNFRTAYAISSQSDQGCIAWSTNWMGTLGTTSLGEQRSDVAIVCRGR
jgi:hypothetical protein